MSRRRTRTKNDRGQVYFIVNDRVKTADEAGELARKIRTEECPEGYHYYHTRIQRDPNQHRHDVEVHFRLTQGRVQT